MKNFNKVILSFLFSITTIVCVAQSNAPYLVVKNKEVDVQALPEKLQRYDLNNMPTSLIQFESNLSSLHFEGNVVGEVTYDGVFYNVYVMQGSRKIDVQCPGLLPTTVVFDSKINGNEFITGYFVESVLPQRVIAQASNDSILLSVVAPTNGTIYVDNKAIGKNFVYVSKGEHIVELVAGDFSEHRIVDVRSNAYNTVDFDIYGRVVVNFKYDDMQIDAENMEGAYPIDETVKKNNSVEFKNLRGKYKFTVHRNGYDAKSKLINIESSEDKKWTPKWNIFQRYNKFVFLSYEYSKLNPVGFNLGMCGELGGAFLSLSFNNIKDKGGEEGLSFFGGLMFQLHRHWYLQVGGGYWREDGYGDDTEYGDDNKYEEPDKYIDDDERKKKKYFIYGGSIIYRYSNFFMGIGYKNYCISKSILKRDRLDTLNFNIGICL